MKRLLLLTGILLYILGSFISVHAGPKSVADPKNKHNLSISGPGPIKALNETQVCIFCHTPHNANPEGPLWNKDTNAKTTYINYWSHTLNTYTSPKNAPNINGVSKMCLSCHDGTIAIGAVRSRPQGIAVTSSSQGLLSAEGRLTSVPGLIGTDLSGSHPISFVFDQRLAALNPSLIVPSDRDVRLDRNGEMQCTSCHDPHDDSKANDQNNPDLHFWQKATFDEVCLACHSFTKKTAKNPVHLDTQKMLKGCGSCHKGHGMQNTAMLPSSSESKECFQCHGDSTVVAKAKNARIIASTVTMQNQDVEKEFQKPYHHPIETEALHSDSEILPETDASQKRHVACADCHNVHTATKENPVAGVSGSRSGRVFVEQTDKEYEVCYKCHSYNYNLPGDEKNKALEFNPTNQSYHPVEAVGKNTRVPSLIYPLTTSSIIKCTDCHGSDDINAPKGPHGSIYRYILRWNYSTADGQPESPFSYQLCYQCHKRENLLSNASFKEHNRHINMTSCYTCHNSHGSKSNPYLLEFNPTVVFPNKDGILSYIDHGGGNVECFLRCHNYDHGSLSSSQTKTSPQYGSPATPFTPGPFTPGPFNPFPFPPKKR